MSSYAITGASKGIGLEFVRQLSANTSNTVLAIVRNPGASEIAELASKHPNLHVVKGDVTDPKSTLDAASTASTITGGKLDVLIHNSNAKDSATVAFSPSQFPFDAEAVRASFEPSFSTAIYGGLWATNAFLPLIEKGSQKKVVHISTPMGDTNFINKTGISYAVAYSVAKGGMNIQVAKYAAELAPKGIKVLALSPGWVDTRGGEKPAHLIPGDEFMRKQFQVVDPEVKGPMLPEESVRKCLEVIERLDEKSSGLLLSHNGDRERWFTVV